MNGTGRLVRSIRAAMNTLSRDGPLLAQDGRWAAGTYEPAIA